MSAELEDSYERHRWVFDGHRVTQLLADLGCARLQSCSLDALLEIRLGATFSLRQPDGLERIIEPEASEQLAPLLSLIGRMLLELTVTREGSLLMTFSDGTTIAIDSHPEFEAFEVTGGGEFESVAYLACPGGGSPWG